MQEDENKMTEKPAIAPLNKVFALVALKPRAFDKDRSVTLGNNPELAITWICSALLDRVVDAQRDALEELLEVQENGGIPESRIVRVSSSNVTPLPAGSGNLSEIPACNVQKVSFLPGVVDREMTLRIQDDCTNVTEVDIYRDPGASGDSVIREWLVHLKATDLTGQFPERSLERARILGEERTEPAVPAAPAFVYDV